jgi:hypothetical protein
MFAITFLSFQINKYLYLYVCVCVCVCAYVKERQSPRPRQRQRDRCNYDKFLTLSESNTVYSGFPYIAI